MKTILLGWNDAEFLPQAIRSLQEQTVKAPIVYVDDESSDDSVEIAVEMLTFGRDEIVCLKRNKRVFGGFPILAENVNAGLKYVNPNDDFFMVMCADGKLEKTYIEDLLLEFAFNPKLVAASGMVRGEYSFSMFPRGAGRMYRMSFWNKYIHECPNSFLWESYPVYKAMSLGFETRSFSNISFTVLRPSRLYKPIYGFAMKELGYLRLYAYARIFLAFVQNPKIGLQMFKTYRNGPEPFDRELSSWIKRYQLNRIIGRKGYELAKKIIKVI